MKNIIKILIVILFFTLSINICYAEEVDIYSESTNTLESEISTDELYKAKVTKVGGIFENEYKYQEVTVEMLDGPTKGESYDIKYTLKVLDTAELEPLELGEKVYVIFAEGPNGTYIPSISDVYRLPYLIFITILFLLLIIVIGKFQGLKTVISLVVTILGIFCIMIPAIMNGASAAVSSIITCTIIAIITFVLISGFKRKTLVAILGTMFGVLVAGVLSSVVASLGHITGLADCEAHMLVYVSQSMTIDIDGMLFAGILIGTVGATMDVAMSIASSMTEVLDKVPNISIKELIKSGMNVGKDAMGTMSNTLIFAYVGESLILIILLMNTGASFNEIVNSDQIATEIVRGLASTIGMISAIPLTTLVFGFIQKYFPKKKSRIEQMVEENIERNVKTIK